MLNSNKYKIYFALILIMAFAAFAQEKKFNEPILLTSAGQSADVLLMKAVLQKDSLKFVYEAQANAAHVETAGSVILVLGGSSKGLGAAKISIDDEKKRINDVVTAAKKRKIPILAVHLGGANRRGALSDDFIKLGAEDANHLIVVSGGDEDGLFKGIAEAKKIPLEAAPKILDVGSLVKKLYLPVQE